MLSGQSSRSCHWMYWEVRISRMHIPLCRMESYFGEIQLTVMIYLKSKKRLIRIITNSNNNAPCRELFESLKILPLQSQYIYWMLLFITKNNYQFFLNSHIHAINTRHKINLLCTCCQLNIITKRCLLLRNQDFQSSADNH